MKLYSFAGSCALATHIVMAWIGKPYEVQMIQKDDLAGPAMRKLNPLGKVPILDTGDGVLYENDAILHYLAETSPEARLLGDGTPRGHAEVNRWLAVINSDVHPTFKPLFGATAYLEDETAIAKTQDNARQQLRGYFEVLDKQLEGREWLAGTRSIADPYLFVVLMWTGFVNVDLSGLANLAAFTKRMRADAGVQRALKEQGLDKGH
ncbi:MAG TPA: glutathione S-transferase N-terminal domain-containing protein [Rhodanobacteraceae bacterium]